MQKRSRVSPDLSIIWGCTHGMHCLAAYKRMGSINWENNLLRRVADVVELSIELRAKAALEAFLSIIELRSVLSLDKHTPS